MCATNSASTFGMHRRLRGECGSGTLRTLTFARRSALAKGVSGARFLLRPTRPMSLRGVIDPDRDDADVLDDGTLIVSTSTEYRLIEQDGNVGIGVLSTYGSRLFEAHDDPRGVLFVPGERSAARTYEGVVEAFRGASRWVTSSGALRFRKDKRVRVRPGPALSAPEELARAEERLFAALSKPEVIQRLASIMAARSASGTVVVLLQRSSPEPLAPQVLSDGTLVVETNRAEGDAERCVAHEVEYGDLSLLASEHVDPRGIPSFRSPSLHLLAGARDYEDALYRLGAAVTFLVPEAEEEASRARFRSERLRAYLARE